MTTLRLDRDSAECLVLTFKEGILSAVAHDLEIRVERLEVTIDDAPLSVRARLEAGSLRVVTAVKDGVPQRAALSAADRAKIEETLATEVLHAQKHPDIAFASTSVAVSREGYLIAGTLTLHGLARPISFVARERGDKLVAEVRLHQPDFGIKPYSAMLGSLKVKPEVVVRITAPRAAIDALVLASPPPAR
jgi:hypothetical protein